MLSVGTPKKCPMRDTFCPSLDICAPKPHKWVPRMQPQPKIKDFRPGTPIYPVPVVSQRVPVRGRRGHNTPMSEVVSHYSILHASRVRGRNPILPPVTFSAQGGVVRWCASAKRRGCRTSLLSRCGAPGRPQTRARRVSPCRGSVRRPCRASAVFPPDRR